MGQLMKLFNAQLCESLPVCGDHSCDKNAHCGGEEKGGRLITMTDNKVKSEKLSLCLAKHRAMKT